MSLLGLSLVLGLVGQSGQVVSVPFRTGENAIIVDAVLNGKNVSLMFDSGFGGTVILDQSIDVGPSTGEMTLRDFVGELKAHTVALKSLKLGQMNLNPDEKLIVEQPTQLSLQYGKHVDGIMGLSAIKDQVVEINFEKKQFIFYPKSLDISTRTPDNKKTFLTKMLPIGGNAIELPVTTASGQLLTMALDTGNSFYATSHKDVLERIGVWKEDQTPNFVRESGVASGAVNSWSKKMPQMNIFGVPVQQTVWDIIDLPSSDARGDGTVGFGFLSNFNVTFDFARRRVWFENWHQPIENPEVGDLGISAHYDRTTKRVVVVLVAPGSPADKAGMKEGDQLLSVDGTDLERPSYLELRALFEGVIGSKVELAASRDGVLKRYHLVRVALDN